MLFGHKKYLFFSSTLDRKERYRAEGFQDRYGTWTLHYPWGKKQEGSEKCEPKGVSWPVGRGACVLCSFSG